MSNKTANVLAHVEPEIKEEAEAILSQLGVPVSTAINMFYRQIIMTQSIPFSISVPRQFKSLEDMSDEEFEEMIEIGLRQIKEGKTIPLDEAFEEIDKSLGL